MVEAVPKYHIIWTCSRTSFPCNLQWATSTRSFFFVHPWVQEIRCRHGTQCLRGGGASFPGAKDHEIDPFRAEGIDHLPCKCIFICICIIYHMSLSIHALFLIHSGTAVDQTPTLLVTQQTSPTATNTAILLLQPGTAKVSDHVFWDKANCKAQTLRSVLRRSPCDLFDWVLLEASPGQDQHRGPRAVTPWKIRKVANHIQSRHLENPKHIF